MGTKLEGLWVLRDIGEEWEIIRPASPADLVEAFRELPGVEEAWFPYGIVDVEAALEPGRYLVYPIDETEET